MTEARRLRWTPRALRRLKSIRGSIAPENPVAADRILQRIVEAAETLAIHPAMGRPGRILGTRELVLADTHYLIAYRVSEVEIAILTVMHAAQMWPEAL
jgi:addiction module RelE/StbE family toxin